MLLVFLYTNLLLTLNSNAELPIPSQSPSPRPSNIANVVLKLETPEEYLEQAETKTKALQFKEVIKLYTDYLRKFPAHAQYLHTRYLLGLAYIQEREWKLAATELNTVIEKWQITPDSLDARLKLATASIEIKKWSEAVLIAQEILDNSPNESPLRPEAHWLQARAHFENHNPLEAKKAADRFFSESGGKNLNPLSTAELYRIQLRMKLSDCKAKKLPKILAEQEWISQFQNQSLCLFESIPILKSIAKQDQAKVLNQAVREWNEIYDSYVVQPKKIPQPKLRIKPKQLKQYRLEMSQFSQVEQQKLKGQIGDVIGAWEKEVPPEMFAIITKWKTKL
ncbi:MAG: hypothetical protein KA715_10085 [Xanthomonadaceae bacterium]|nr:hypothetical protein [Xanthomonadaceae bacterium]